MSLNHRNHFYKPQDPIARSWTSLYCAWVDAKDDIDRHFPARNPKHHD